MKNQTFVKRLPAAAAAVLSIILLIGVRTFFGACAPHEDGSFMACHWAEMAVFGLAAVLTLEGVLAFLLRNAGIRRGLLLAMVPTALAAALMPGVLIRLCVMPQMRCNSIMRPAVLVVSVLIACAAGAGFLMSGRREA